MTTWVTLPA